jgi:uncharacterized damage-inducible protein DinB
MKTFPMLLALGVAPLFGQSGDNPLSGAVKSQYAMAKNNIIKAAEKMPEEDYSFRPTDQVRTFAELIGHVANANYMFCSAARGEASPNKVNIEKFKTSKGELVQAAKDAFAYCDKVYDGMTDAAAAEKVKFMRSEMPKLGVLTFNNMHDYEHYGNIVTYMRLKSIVPPSSERSQ